MIPDSSSWPEHVITCFATQNLVIYKLKNALTVWKRPCPLKFGRLWYCTIPNDLDTWSHYIATRIRVSIALPRKRLKALEASKFIKVFQNMVPNNFERFGTLIKLLFDHKIFKTSEYNQNILNPTLGKTVKLLIKNLNPQNVWIWAAQFNKGVVIFRNGKKRRERQAPNRIGLWLTVATCSFMFRALRLKNFLFLILPVFMLVPGCFS